MHLKNSTTMCLFRFIITWLVKIIHRPCEISVMLELFSFHITLQIVDESLIFVTGWDIMASSLAELQHYVALLIQLQ